MPYSQGKQELSWHHCRRKNQSANSALETSKLANKYNIYNRGRPERKPLSCNKEKYNLGKFLKAQEKLKKMCQSCRAEILSSQLLVLWWSAKETTDKVPVTFCYHLWRTRWSGSVMTAASGSSDVLGPVLSKSLLLSASEGSTMCSCAHWYNRH